MGKPCIDAYVADADCPATGVACPSDSLPVWTAFAARHVVSDACLLLIVLDRRRIGAMSMPTSRIDKASERAARPRSVNVAFWSNILRKC
jgi:hypothetical protein